MKYRMRALMLMLLMCWASQSSAQATRTKKEYVMGTCIGAYQIEKDSEYNDSNTYLETSAGLGGGDNYAQKFWGIKVPDYIKSEYIEVLRPPKHGNLFYEAFRKDGKPGGAYGSYKYVPERGYLGIDKVTFKITVGERVFKVVYVIKVVSEHDVVNDDPSMYCTKTTWKIL